MHIKSERGSGEIVVIGILGLVVLAAVLMFGMAANSKGMADGAETIAGAIKSSDMTTETFAAWKVSGQTLYPNKHAVERHEADAHWTTNCYNKNGTFKIYRVRQSNEYHMLCRDDDGSVRDIMLERETETSNRFHMRNAFTPKDGIWKNVESWILRKNASPASMPPDTVIVIDGFIP